MALFPATSGGSDEYKAGDSFTVSGGNTVFAGYMNSDATVATVTVPLPKRVKNKNSVTFTNDGNNFYIFPSQTIVPFTDLNVSVIIASEVGVTLRFVKKNGTSFGGSFNLAAINCVFDFTLTFT